MKECDVPEVVVGNLVAHDESNLPSADSCGNGGRARLTTYSA